MKTTIVFVIAMTLAMGATLRADDKQTPDSEMAARIAAAEARLKAKSAAATQTGFDKRSNLAASDHSGSKAADRSTERAGVSADTEVFGNKQARGGRIAG